ncbi:hypothetical protein MTR67_048504 [Solanum verrucosum]|uniref:Tf2-1-like SH3-like domain-containing protein n=1 Tax=Solanum verrucosum TaxID=315347 RepID=A0AAF0V0R1_SOLVR|nr:hypothetical protein MTR67_048504 [Solanum verrucosum]
MTKFAHFIHVKVSYSAEEYAKLYVREIVRLHGVPLSIILDRGPQFTSQFWKSFQKGLGTKVMVHEAVEKIRVIRERLRTAQSRQKSYVDVRRRDLEFDVHDWVYLKISPMKGVMRFGKKGKLSPRFVDPYEILRRASKVAYELDLPNELALVHPVFHVSMLNKCIRDPSTTVFLEGLEIGICG